ncbi:unnamed protein product [Effrenium voratum]|uniref:Protein LTV1 homolog n=1 Tax=Effrenium voratum TaxID=2562239 RepID=A0AA36I3D5_9DINO|nr:unnamed protein product [Effrenium voratum]CAJ1380277.1 unnamed protein product [Effrenium voratum]CAJ1417381.1 unnamed protein product [Effrenium voratum]|mmetsp:Transcript_71726/g.171359  ORF Transcript_71726/g.171359 Transcript_71726/m.171359 type:complete len:462 (+) Transcript_71726:35-1420(+)
MGRRRFAKKGEDVRHFKLVARAGADDDDDKPPLVLEPYAPPGVVRRTGRTEAELLSVPESLQHLGSAIYQPGQDEPEPPRSDPKEDGNHEDGEWGELDGDCYFPPDGYNYEQHLKSVSGTKKAKSVVGVVLQAPEPIKEEEFQKQMATNEDEEEVLRALENDGEYDDLQEDIIAEVVEGGVLEPETMLWGPAALDSAAHPDMAIFAEHKALLGARRGLEDDSDFDDGLDELDGGGASNVKPRDEDFEQFLADQYADDEIGARDEEEIEGNVVLDDDVLDEYLDEKQAEREELLSLYEPQRGFKDDEPRVIAETRAIIEKHYLEEESEEDTESGESEDESNTWDCESVLSTLSNLSNRPGRIGKVKIIKKPPVLKPVTESAGDEEEGEESEEDVVELPDVVTTRPKDETPEEKKARKASVKEMRRICRKMKKESKEVYKREAAKLPGQGGVDIWQKTRAVKY